MRDEIRRVSTTDAAAFDEDWYDFATDDHFWTAWRAKVLLDFIDHRGLPRRSPLRALDVGSGRGIVGRQIEAATDWTVDQVELNPKALSRAVKGRGLRMIYDVLEEREPYVNSYDVVLLQDVIEHIAAPGPFIEAAVRHLKPGGTLFINVPAFQSLLGNYDREVGHLRRYDRESLGREVASAGVTSVEQRYWGLSLLPMLVGRNLVLTFVTDHRKIVRIGFNPPGKMADRLVRLVMQAETRALKAPLFGSSLMLAATRG